MNVDVLWNNFLSQIKEDLSALAFDTWFNDTKLHELKDGKAIIVVPMQIHKKHLADKYSSLIIEKLNNITGTNFELEFLLEDEIKKETNNNINNNSIITENNHTNNGVPPNSFQSNLKSKYSFDNFL